MFGAFRALEEDIALMPIPTMKWKLADNWQWKVGLVSVFDPGAGTEVTWQIGESMSLGTGITFQTRRYRLRDKTRTVGANGRTDDGGIGQETAVPVFATFRWRPTPMSAIDVLGGVAFAGNLRVESRTGGRIHDDDYDPAPFVGMKGSIAF